MNTSKADDDKTEIDFSTSDLRHLPSASLLAECEPNSSRHMCQGCERPQRVCWCGFLPRPLVNVQSSVIILQHPNERKRGIKTAIMATKGIAQDHCRIFRGRKFPGQHEELQGLFERLDMGANDVPSTSNLFILYPGKEALPLSDLKPDQGPYTFIILDGTWDEAKKLFAWNPALQKLPQVSLHIKRPSAYVVRTQPADLCLSTLETVAETLATVEADPSIRDRLVQPLHAMCNFQINHGAVIHDSKEFKEQNSLFVKENNWKKKKVL